MNNISYIIPYILNHDHALLLAEGIENRFLPWIELKGKVIVRAVPPTEKFFQLYIEYNDNFSMLREDQLFKIRYFAQGFLAGLENGEKK